MKSVSEVDDMRAPNRSSADRWLRLLAEVSKARIVVDVTTGTFLPF